MQLLQRSFKLLIKRRLAHLEWLMEHPIEAQEGLFQRLISKSKKTTFGQQFGFSSIRDVTAFKARVPTHTYEQLYPYIERVIKGEQNVLWPTPIEWLAKSSGTTNASSKFIPVSPEALQEGHYKAGKDMLAVYVNNYPNSQVAEGKSVGLGGSLYANALHPGSAMHYGDVSAVLMKNLPFWAQWRRTPNLTIALMSEWEKKVEKLASITSEQNITAIAGVPTWVLLLLQRVMDLQNTSCIHDVWPRLELFIHGGIAFTPYKALFQAISSRALHYLEVYNASEGFFALQDQVGAKDMLLLLDHGIFYEFMPLDEVEKEHPKTIGLAEVVLGKVYALLISTNAGLWRYHIGDTVQFTSLAPFRIKIMGRTKHFINTFGEEVVIDNAEVALEKACRLTDARLSDYTAGPCYLQAGKSGNHEWIIEFTQPPNDIERFIDILDTTLKNVNTDYEAKRYKDMVLTRPVVHCAPRGLFYKWLKKQGKLGDQHKIPRLANDRKYLDDMLAMFQGNVC
ncbi:MAG: GH3 auxin-responsive promoter family protein [Bacteroidota bacterium]